MTDPTNSNYYSQPGVFSDKYSVGTYIGVALGTLYAGIFVMLNNHYVFKPKARKVLQKIGEDGSRTTKVFAQILIELVTHLAVCSMCACSAFLSGSTNSVQSFLACDSLWMGVYASMVLYKCRTDKKPIERKYAVKNTLALLLCYTCLVIHFSLNFYYMTFGLALTLIYVLSQITNIYYDKIEQYINTKLLNGEQENLPSIEQLLKPKSIYPDVATLAQKYPVSERQFQQLNYVFNNKRNNMTLKSKAILYKKLHDIFIHVHLSYKKRIQHQQTKTLNYYGRLNGTVPAGRHIAAEHIERKPLINRLQASHTLIPPSSILKAKQSSSQVIEQGPYQCLLYIFPIRMLQNNQAISAIFSIIINIAYGVLLDYALQVLRRIDIGGLFAVLYSITLMPIMPSTTNIESLHNTMTMSSVFKYGMLGVAIFARTMGISGNYMRWQPTDPLIYISSLQLGFLVYYSVVVLLVRWQQYKFLSMCWLGVFAGHLYLSYSISSSYT